MQRNHHVSILLSADNNWHFILKNCFPSLLPLFLSSLPPLHCFPYHWEQCNRGKSLGFASRFRPGILALSLTRYVILGR